MAFRTEGTLAEGRVDGKKKTRCRGINTCRRRGMALAGSGSENTPRVVKLWRKHILPVPRQKLLANKEYSRLTAPTARPDRCRNPHGQRPHAHLSPHSIREERMNCTDCIEIKKLELQIKEVDNHVAYKRYRTRDHD